MMMVPSFIMSQIEAKTINIWPRYDDHKYLMAILRPEVEYDFNINQCPLYEIWIYPCLESVVLPQFSKKYIPISSMEFGTIPSHDQLACGMIKCISKSFCLTKPIPYPIRSWSVTSPWCPAPSWCTYNASSMSNQSHHGHLPSSSCSTPSPAE